ncbi:MAG TPA: universal stress protein [Candidatus Acidoferrum sp.]|jgi:hypothetical protein|nr:universal stress protein [Candidatus Acidoferrum sp.]
MSPHEAEREVRETPGPAENGEGPRLSVVLPHTQIALTAIALREAVRLARGLNARVIVLCVRVVPFPQDLDPTRGCPDLSELMTLAESTGEPVAINVVYARNWESACEHALSRGSVVVMAVRKRWFRSREERMAVWLARCGYNVTTIPA